MSLSLESVNEYFRSVAVTSQPPRLIFHIMFPFKFGSVNQSRVSFFLKNLNEKKSVGPDGVSARFLKEVSGGSTNKVR